MLLKLHLHENNTHIGTQLLIFYIFYTIIRLKYLSYQLGGKYEKNNSGIHFNNTFDWLFK